MVNIQEPLACVHCPFAIAGDLQIAVLIKSGFAVRNEKGEKQMQKFFEGLNWYFFYLAFLSGVL